MKLLIAAASAALLAFPVVAQEPMEDRRMWMLRIALCLQFDKWNADCRKRGGWGPYGDLKDCKADGDAFLAGAKRQAESSGAKVLFLKAYCIQGKDT